ncbi:hypothetical protein TEPIDINF_001062 [Tepidibacillus infernus]|nr:hypothetical protein [Tepidibacillus sp. HK-1]
MTRVKVIIRCNQCGEKFFLRGRMDQHLRLFPKKERVFLYSSGCYLIA